MLSIRVVGYDDMTPSVIFLSVVITLILAHPVLASDPQGCLLNCGGSTNVTLGSLTYVPDEGFINVGKNIAVNAPNLLPILSSLRYFPDTSSRKYCYSIPVTKGEKYLVRTIYYYGRFDGGSQPPVFDQIIDGTKWSVVNTTLDFGRGLSSYYEVVVVAMEKSLSVCLARNAHTGHSYPFISALEVEHLDGSVYNPTDFKKYALVTVARHTFGADGDIISFPDDKFNRMWQPFKDQNPAVSSHSNVTSDFWNLPPARVFNSGITASKGNKLELQWPDVSLPATNYYIALYFQDNRTPSPYSWRVFDVAINGQTYYSKLNATVNGVSVYAPEWPLSGHTKITLTPADGMPVGPVINAGEIFLIVPLGGETLPSDVTAMESLKKSLKNPPPDWTGDPCLPKENSWTGVTCSEKHNNARVKTVDLRNAGISGSIPSDINILTALSHLWLRGNNLTGKIPDMSGMNELETLHLDDNQLEGSIPPSLGQLPKLREIFLQNNKLDGKIPNGLETRRVVKV